VLHGDNGANLKATTVLAMLAWLGIRPSYSRPRVGDDNPFIEACSAPPNTAPSFRPRASLISTPHANGPPQGSRMKSASIRIC
jgi:putative transposase